jgi:hypothetical protein
VQCHGAGNPNRDYTLREQVARDTDLIRCGVAVQKEEGCGDWPPPSQFPIGGGPHPAENERYRLVAWLKAGAPDTEGWLSTCQACAEQTAACRDEDCLRCIYEEPRLGNEHCDPSQPAFEVESLAILNAQCSAACPSR